MFRAYLLEGNLDLLEKLDALLRLAMQRLEAAAAVSSLLARAAFAASNLRRRVAKLTSPSVTLPGPSGLLNGEPVASWND
jgi:hypothetical protein